MANICDGDGDIPTLTAEEKHYKKALKETLGLSLEALLIIHCVEAWSTLAMGLGVGLNEGLGLGSGLRLRLGLGPTFGTADSREQYSPYGGGKKSTAIIKVSME